MDPWCWSCGVGRVITDLDSGGLVCDSCGRVHSASALVSQTTFTADGRPDSSTQLLYSVGDFGYRERKLHAATLAASNLLTSLGLNPSRASEALRLALDATDGELATPSSAFLLALAAASAYIVMRRHHLPVSLAQVARAVYCDPRDLAHLAGRLARHLDLPPLPAFDADRYLEHAVRNSPSLSAADNPEKLISQGRFLLHCSTKWALTTGRHPLPMVAAIIFFVAEVNGQLSVSIDEIARDLYAGIATSRLRHKELKQTLVRVAKALLPWGEDVTAKNLVQNAPLLLQLMAMKTNSKPSEEASFLDEFTFDPSELANAYSFTAGKEECKYFQLENGEGDGDDEKMESLKLSGECLVSAYDNVLERLASLKNPRELGKDQGNKKRGRGGGLDIEAWTDSCKTRLEANKDLSFEEIIGRDVGYDAPPPSFVNGKELRSLRRAKIEAARLRINEVMKPQSAAADLQVRKDECPGERAVGRKRRRKRKGDRGGIDWEDCIIEVLLLHRVEEEEIEQGQYNRLLDLHVFGSLGT
ncbi:plant-specific TFIIB-related protein PTF2 [Typha latifolia]|uniref:plant-specific TFIIB-related protein PTF2 n=1 Tax=Typha latifolia TaxID=4733 RepID=UPI003C2ADBA4